MPNPHPIHKVFRRLYKLPGDWPGRIRSLLLRTSLAFVSLQALMVGALVVADSLRKRRSKPVDGYPQSSHPTIELENERDSLKLYSDGSQLYDEMLRDIENAQEMILLETFIWKGDDIGKCFVRALERKVNEGVQVFVVFDWFANLVVSPSFKQFPKGIRTLVFHRIDGPIDLASPLKYLRDHRKLLVIDGKVAYVGGFNIGKMYTRRWRDTQVRINGPAVREFENCFADLWNSHRDEHLPSIIPKRGRDWDPSIIVHRNDPYMRIFPIRGVYLEAIDRAERHIYLTHAYFVPDRALRASLKDAARRGVDVQLIIPWHSNHVVADWLGRRFFDELLASGVRIFTYNDIMIHSKTATVDSVWSTVGTANMDRLSLLGNYELNVEIYSSRFAQEMERMFERDKRNATEITLEDWRQRSMTHKVIERTLESLAPLV